MKCPKKNCHGKSRVLSTNYKKGITVRYRKCLTCGDTFTTKETYEDSPNYKRLYYNLIKELKKLTEN